MAGISPTGPNISGLRLPPLWHFLPPGTCTTVGVGEGLGTTPSPVGTPGSPGALLLRTRGRRWYPQPGSPEETNGQGSSLGTLTWPLSSKGLIGPFFGGGIRGGPGTSSKLPGGWEQWGHCGSCGVRADCWHRHGTRGGPSPRARLPAGSLPQVLPATETSSQPSPRWPGPDSWHRQYLEGPPALSTLPSRLP